jgi:hypothetical protein
MSIIGGLFKQSGTRYEMSEDDKFYLMSCSDLLGKIPSVLEGIAAMHDFFWDKIAENKYEKAMRKYGNAAKSTLSEADIIRVPERFKAMHEHLTRGLGYLNDSYGESLVYLTDRQREHIAKAIELALLGSAELRDGNRLWEKIKEDTKRE